MIMREHSCRSRISAAQLDRPFPLLDNAEIPKGSMPSASMDSLPVELLEGILACLPIPDLYTAGNVCKSWRQLCSSSAISPSRQKLRDLTKYTRSDSCMASIRCRTKPFIQAGFDREAYIARIGGPMPEDFKTWVLEYAVEDSIGWHWPGIKDEHKRERFQELNLDWVDAMTFSRHLKPGYTLLPASNIVIVEDPDYTLYNLQNPLHYPGSFQKTRPKTSNRVRALLVWADLSSYTPKLTILILDGSDHWDGHVWLTETRSPRFDAQDDELGLNWIEPLGSWTGYLERECRSLGENYGTLQQYKSYRSGGRVWMRPTH